MDTRWITAVVVVIVLALGAVYFLRTPQTGTPNQMPTSTTQRALKTFYNEKYGIALNYPENYEVRETDATGEGTPRHTIIFADRTALAGVPAASEGPPAVTIDIVANPSNSTPENWVKATSMSNYKLSPDGQLSKTAVAGQEAVAYGWDGLYRSNSIVINHKKQIYMFSVGYNAPTDEIIKDFASIIASVQFDP